MSSIGRFWWQLENSQALSLIPAFCCCLWLSCRRFLGCLMKLKFSQMPSNLAAGTQRRRWGILRTILATLIYSRRFQLNGLRGRNVQHLGAWLAVEFVRGLLTKVVKSGTKSGVLLCNPTPSRGWRTIKSVARMAKSLHRPGSSIKQRLAFPVSLVANQGSKTYCRETRKVYLPLIS